MSKSDWDRVLWALLPRIAEGQARGELTSSKELRDAYPWDDDFGRLMTFESLYDNGYIIALPDEGGIEEPAHFNEMKELRLGIRGEAELARLAAKYALRNLGATNQT